MVEKKPVLAYSYISWFRDWSRVSAFGKETGSQDY